MQEFPHFCWAFLTRTLGPRLLPYAALVGAISTGWEAPFLAWITPVSTCLLLPAFLFCWAWTNANLGGHFFVVPRMVAGWIPLGFHSLVAYLKKPKTETEGDISLIFVCLPLVVLAICLGGCLLGIAKEPHGLVIACSYVCFLDIIFLIIASIRYLPTFMTEVWPREAARIKARTQYRTNFRFLRDMYSYARFQADLADCIPDDATPQQAWQGCRKLMDEMGPLIEEGRRFQEELDARLLAIDREIEACRATIEEDKTSPFPADLEDDVLKYERRIRELEQQRQAILDRE